MNRVQGRGLALLHVLFLLSGLTALVYEVLWLRGFAIVLGGTLESMSSVLCAFMLGLALGSALAGRALAKRALSVRQCLLVYGALELVIGLYGFGFTAALFLGQQRAIELLAPLTEGRDTGRMLVHFAFSFATLVVPTTCMGATLPVLSMALARGADTSGLYGTNTLGAATGSLLASFVLIYNFGCLASAGITAGLNGAILLLALAGARRADGSAPSATGTEPAAPEDDAAPEGRWSPLAVNFLAFFSGYTFFGFELVWNRCLGMVLGNRVYVTSVTLALVIGCLFLGARIARAAAMARRSTASTLGLSYGFAAATTILALYLAGPALRGSDRGVTLSFVGILIVLPAAALGVGFPLLLALPVKQGGRGSHVGTLYAWNTLGSVVGTLLTGYYLVGALGSARLIIVMALLIVVCAGLIWAGSPRRTPLGAVALVLVAGGLVSQRNVTISVVPPSATVVLQEDRHGIFSIAPVESNQLSVRCDATELVYLYGNPFTQFVQESQAHVPLAFAKARKRVLVIGSGYGITAGAFSTHEDVALTDAVEILPLIVAHADRFEPGNHGYHHHPRVKVHVQDGRYFLAMTKEPYDIISINVSDPYLPGSASLFSREFYELTATKLAPGGIVAQHVFGLDTPSLIAGFRKHFPHLRAVEGYGNSVTLIGSKEPLEARGAAEFNANERVRATLQGIGRGRETLEQLLAEGDRRLGVWGAQPVIFENSDVMPALEFRRSDKLNTFFSNN